MEGLRADLENACNSLQVEDDVKELALKMLERCLPPTVEPLQSAQVEDVRRLKLACLLYLSKKVRSRDLFPGPTTWGLSEILKHFRLSIPDFLQELPVLVKESMPTLSMMFGEDIERKLSVRELQTAFVHILVLGKKARDIFVSFFDLPTQLGQKVAPVLQLMWSLFILAKAELLGPLPDLVSSFNLLVCVSHAILVHIPPSLCNINFADKTKFPVRVESGAPDTLASMAAASKTSIAEIKPLASNLDILMQDLLSDEVPAAPDFPFPDGLVAENRSGFPGLLEEPKLEKALQLLDRKYEEKFRKVGEIDERSFIQRKEAEVAATKLGPTMATPPSLTKCQVHTPIRRDSLQGLPLGTPMQLMPSPLRPSDYSLKTPSPVRANTSSLFATPGAVTRTPLTESMHLTAWLRDTLSTCAAHPSEALKGFFKACEGDMTASVMKRVQSLSNNIFPAIQGPSGIACMQSTMARERKFEGIKLYYRVLENMLKAEEARSGKKDFTALLNNETFHKCLLACSFEMVVASYRMVTLAFPAVLERLQLKAFDLCKVIETFVRHEPLLPRELKRHLFNIEEKMLECLAWERGSSLYVRLISACNEPEGNPKTSLQDLFDSQERNLLKRDTAVSQTAGTSDERVNKDVKASADSQQIILQNTPTKRSREGSPQEEDTSPPKLQKGPAGLSRVPSGQDSPPQEARSISLTGGLLSPMRGPGQSAFQAFLSPMRPSASVGHPFIGALPTAFGSPSQHKERPGRAIIADFLRKVLKLSLLRLEDLCERIDCELLDKQNILTQVYTMVQHVIYHQTHLLYNRHLDQILLSALYGICKVNHLKQISFKEIIQHYKKQPQAKTDIFRTVIITQSEPDMTVSRTGDIIEFYNSVFIPTVKPFVLQLGQRKAPLIQPTTANQARRTLLTPSPRSAAWNGVQTPPPAAQQGTPSAVKVYLSPLRQSPKQPFLTPKSKIFYAGRMGESSNAYQSPSKDLKYINNRIALHSQIPVAVSSAHQGASEPHARSIGPTSSDHSCSSGPSSGEDDSAVVPPSHSQANGHHTRSRPGSSQAEQSSGGVTALDLMAQAAARRSGGSGLDDLHDAAMLLGGSDHDDSPPTSVTRQQRTRRSRRQAGRAPQ